jgi:putative PIN family toxin of toxin-antitoxin system
MAKKIRIIIDTNLWISFLLTKKFNFIDKLLSKGNIQLIFCDELLAELTEVTLRPKLKKFFTEKDWRLIFNIIDRYAVYISVVSSITACRDEKDNFLLSLAKDAKADYLITGDKDLLILKTFENTQIVSFAEYQVKMLDY